MFCQHGMNGMTQLMRHGCHIIHFTLIIKQHPGCKIGGGSGTESPSMLALAHLAIYVVCGKDAFRQAGESWIELIERLQHFCGSRRIGKGLIRLGDRSIDIIPSQFFHPQQAGFEAEEALENVGILATGFQQQFNHFIR